MGPCHDLLVILFYVHYFTEVARYRGNNNGEEGTYITTELCHSQNDGSTTRQTRKYFCVEEYRELSPQSQVLHACRNEKLLTPCCHQSPHLSGMDSGCLIHG